MKTKIFSMIILMICLDVAHAEGGSCPDGYYPIGGQGSSGCAPIPGYGSSSSGSSEQIVVWEDRWGAIATDYAGGKFGVGKSWPSKSMAQAAAIKDCVREGGKSCKIDLTYSNQCGAIAWGMTYAATARAPTLEEASSMALDLCSEASLECRIYYSDCSYQAIGR